MQIDTTFETSDKFFNLNIDVKRKYTKKTGTTKNGWDELERERYTYLRKKILSTFYYNEESKRDRP